MLAGYLVSAEPVIVIIVSIIIIISVLVRRGYRPPSLWAGTAPRAVLKKIDWSGAQRATCSSTSPSRLVNAHSTRHRRRKLPVVDSELISSSVLFSTSVTEMLTTWLWLTVSICQLAIAEIAFFGRQPNGLNPTLYHASEDPILQLDETSFNDTVYCAGFEDCSAFLIEFYSDWCGHCRTYAPLYKALAKDLRGWTSTLKVAAMNCADPINEITCRANGVQFFPYLKYFPRNSSHGTEGTKLRPLQSVAEMRDQVTRILIGEYSIYRYSDWPAFDFLGEINTYGELWQGASASTNHLAIIFEEDTNSLIGAQLLLDLTQYNGRLLARRCLKTHPLVDALHITDFPTLAVFKRGERVPVLLAELRRLLLTELEDFMRNEEENRDVQLTAQRNRTSQMTICNREPERCRKLHYVSESDMLKAMRYALYREVARTGGNLQGANLTALFQFVDALATHFPRSTFSDSESFTEMALPNSDRARNVFMHMRDWLLSKGLGKVIPVDEWQSEFIKVEDEQLSPFANGADWEHCKGTTPMYRGYTCGLWTAFHALSVQAYKDRQSDENFRPLAVLQAIRDWIDAFFGCRHCRDHFIRMTSRTYKMEVQVRKSEDVFMYLWKAHNIVNARLKGRDTEDPQFPKYQFPAHFLCPNCTYGTAGVLDEGAVQSFIVDYYSHIRPYRP